MANFCQVAICTVSFMLDDMTHKYTVVSQSVTHFHPSIPGHPQPKTLIYSFSALVQFLLMVLEHYFKVSIHTNRIFSFSN